MVMLISVNTNFLIKEKNLIVSHWTFHPMFSFIFFSRDTFYSLLIVLSNDTERFIFFSELQKKNLCCESWQEIYPHTSFFQLLHALSFSEHGRSEAWKSQGFKFFSSFQPLIKKIWLNWEKKKMFKLMIQHKTKWSFSSFLFGPDFDMKQTFFSLI